MFAQVQSYKPALKTLNKVDADVITFESCSSGGMDLEAIGREITDMKVAIGVIDHHSLQVESPTEVAAHIRLALKHIPAERLVLSSDCGMGREGMARRSAKKRFKLTGSGKIKRKHAYKSHILTKKSKKRKLRLTQSTLVDQADKNSILEQLCLK
jgi:ribosomal protein L35